MLYLDHDKQRRGGTQGCCQRKSGHFFGNITHSILLFCRISALVYSFDLCLFLFCLMWSSYRFCPYYSSCLLFYPVTQFNLVFEWLENIICLYRSWQGLWSWSTQRMAVDSTVSFPLALVYDMRKKHQKTAGFSLFIVGLFSWPSIHLKMKLPCWM